jgi:broad specificity phosphatase PhoE
VSIIYLIRHGESLSNVSPEIFGYGDENMISLTHTGVVQASSLGIALSESLQYSARIEVLTSPQLRSIQTANIALRSMFVREPALFPRYQGTTIVPTLKEFQSFHTTRILDGDAPVHFSLQPWFSYDKWLADSEYPRHSDYIVADDKNESELRLRSRHVLPYASLVSKVRDVAFEMISRSQSMDVSTVVFSHHFTINALRFHLDPTLQPLPYSERLEASKQLPVHNASPIALEIPNA